MNRRQLLVSAAVLPLFGTRPAFAQDLLARSPLAHIDSPKPPLQDILNGTIKGRRFDRSDRVEPVMDLSGFDKTQLYSVPKPGEHPRLLFSRRDIPRIRAQLTASPRAKALWSDLLRLAAGVETAPNDWASRVYRALAQGDLTAVVALQSDPASPNAKGPPGSTRNTLQILLWARALKALLEDDATVGRETAQAVDTYARFLRPQVRAALASANTENYWNSTRPVMGDSATVAFLYDFSQPYMSREQVENVRSLIVEATSRRYGLGMDLPPHWRNWNFIGMAAMFPLMQLAIEGEPGYEPRIVERGFEVARDYILYGNSENGIGREAMGYHTLGMLHAASFKLAMANRGRNLFGLVRWRRMFDRWMVWAMQPYGGAWASEGDLGTYPPAAALMGLARSLYPKDPCIEQVAAQTPNANKLDGWTEDMLVALLYPSDLSSPAAKPGATGCTEGWPLSLFDAERGVMFARSGWGTSDLSLQIVARNDTLNASHDHADRGGFYLSSHGRTWAIPSLRETQSQYHSVILIDGKGQGYFPTPATWTSHTLSPQGATATIDQSYAYNWRWMKSSFLATDEQLKAEPWLDVFRGARDRLASRYPAAAWQRDPLPMIRKYYEPNLAGDPRMWGDEDAWVLRTPYNPVKTAIRRFAMVRAKQPFVLISDTIEKDEQERLYEWHMVVPSDVELYQMSGQDIILGPVTGNRVERRRPDGGFKDSGMPVATKGAPMLLVRILSMTEAEVPDEALNPVLETLHYVKTDDTHQFAGRSFGLGKRLCLPVRTKRADYRVMLLPYSHGDALPKTEWQGDVLRVTTASGVSRIQFGRAGSDTGELIILEAAS
ncbi:hypothetical protein PQU94_05340 [Asticcacaulis sp. DXS10W]|uniref:Uncharacterized protein n=1 Tax=Asticcacaulis currens TaxID=2984210 RepID=A0ABT5ICL1_9CAUL|nr:hypothetical protein [Asticcacaulis currens]MDC7693703.1 hypothetical protein [Asticcacaulis currens]